VDNIKELAFIRIRDNLPKSWPVASPSFTPLHLASAVAISLTCVMARHIGSRQIGLRQIGPLENVGVANWAIQRNESMSNFLYCQIQNASFFARVRLCIHRIADPRFARIDKFMSFTNHSFLLTYHSFMSLHWFLPCQTQCHRFSVYFNLNPECYDTYIM